ncbi:MAG: transcriptional regulator NrdR [Pseudomonadota bacterium]
MRCPFCGNQDTQVKDSRPTEDNTSIRRRRFCPQCGARFTTFERVQLRDLVVMKSDGKREPFERDKVLRSMQVALRKRPISEEQVERMVNSIVRRLETAGEGEVTTQQIGEAVMDTLADLDQIAYVRYASVYKDFREVADFNQFLDGIGDLSAADAEQAKAAKKASKKSK